MERRERERERERVRKRKERAPAVPVWWGESKRERSIRRRKDKTERIGVPVEKGERERDRLCSTYALQERCAIMGRGMILNCPWGGRKLSVLWHISYITHHPNLNYKVV